MIFREVIARCDQLDLVLIEERLPHEEIQELRSLIPPMAEQFRIVRGENYGSAILGRLRSFMNLFEAAIQEMASVFGRSMKRDVAVVSVFFRRAGDPIIFNAGEAALRRSRQKRLYIIKVEVKRNVAVKIAVIRIARVTLIAAPDLPGGIVIAPENGDAIWSVDRGKGAVSRARPRVKEPVSIRDEPANVCLLEHIFHVGHIGAFRQPDAAWVTAETGLVVIASNENLGTDGFWVTLQQRK